MSDPEFSVKKFKEILQSRIDGVPQPKAMSGHPPIYWDFYADKGRSPIYRLNEIQILAMSDGEIMEAYAKWRIES